MSLQQYIIMADVISSRQLKEKTAFMAQFKQLTALANTQFGPQIVSPLTITLGDEFQGIVNNAETLLRLMFFLDEQIIAQQLPFALRYALVYGRIDTPINTQIAYEMYGPGLTRAREALKETKDKGGHYFVQLQTGVDPQLQLCLKLYQAIKTDWKFSEFKIVSAFLNHDDYKALERLGLYKTRSGAWKKKKTLRIEEYNTVKALIFKILAHG